MGQISTAAMRMYLGRAIKSLNTNKLVGMGAEASFRSYIAHIGEAQRVSPGGWIFRQKREDFGKNTIAVFPHCIEPGRDYSSAPSPADIPTTLHTICATMHQIGIRSYFAHPLVTSTDDTEAISWKLVQLGVPWLGKFEEVDAVFGSFVPRTRRHNYLANTSDASAIPAADVMVQFSHENLRIFVENRYFSETSDIDGIIWGERYTYPIEIKEKATAHDTDLGDWFGLDTGPFVKLAHYAARRGNLHSLFIVREVDDTPERNFVRWLFVEFDELARYASWVPRAGGQAMGGGTSSVVRVPRSAFRELTPEALTTI